MAVCRMTKRGRGEFKIVGDKCRVSGFCTSDDYYTTVNKAASQSVKTSLSSEAGYCSKAAIRVYITIQDDTPAA